jgi:hypothetical protein
MMIGLGMIPTIGNATNRIHEMRLFQEVAKVDEKEAEQGALHSDGFRLNSRDKEDRILTRQGLTGKLSKFWLNLKSKKMDSEKGPEDDCPIAQARAESAVGENAPLGWLTLDHLAQNHGSGISPRDTLVSESEVQVPSEESTLLSFLRPDPDDADYMFNEEWFLSPCG